MEYKYNKLCREYGEEAVTEYDAPLRAIATPDCRYGYGTYGGFETEGGAAGDDFQTELKITSTQEQPGLQKISCIISRTPDEVIMLNFIRPTLLNITNVSLESVRKEMINAATRRTSMNIGLLRV